MGFSRLWPIFQSETIGRDFQRQATRSQQSPENAEHFAVYAKNLDGPTSSHRSAGCGVHGQFNLVIIPTTLASLDEMPSQGCQSSGG
jgi:hypothetical protein